MFPCVPLDPLAPCSLFSSTATSLSGCWSSTRMMFARSPSLPDQPLTPHVPQLNISTFPVRVLVAKLCSIAWCDSNGHCSLESMKDSRIIVVRLRPHCAPTSCATLRNHRPSSTSLVPVSHPSAGMLAARLRSLPFHQQSQRGYREWEVPAGRGRAERQSENRKESLSEFQNPSSWASV